MENRSNPDSNSNPERKPPHKILSDFITNETNNKQWLNYAFQLLLPVPEPVRKGLLDPEDYVGEVKTCMLYKITIVDDNPREPVFELITKTRVLLMNRQFLKHHIFLQIHTQISHAIRSQKKIVRYPDDKDIEDNSIVTWDDSSVCTSIPNGGFIAKFEYSLDENIISTSKELIELCLTILEKKNILYKLIFDDRLSGITNREIALKYNLPIGQIENLIKKIIRYLKKYLSD